LIREGFMTVVAHRGIHQVEPENSLEAFASAWNAGVEWCECDIRGSIEHEPFILHDATLDRTTSGAGEIAQSQSAALSALRLRRADGSISHARLVTLAHVMRSMPSGSKMLIEIKPSVDEEVVRRTLELCDEVSCIVQSFDRQVLMQAERIRPSIRRMLLVDDAVKAMQPGPWEGINTRHDVLLPEQIELLREMKMSVGVWTPNEPANIRRAIGLGVDMIISDEPLRVMELLKALQRLR
jgi:glycerophosphoryl diester phosphodiesterase